MARLGAGVMQPRSVETGRLYNIPIHVRSTFTNKPGTIRRVFARFRKYKVNRKVRYIY